MAKVVFVLEDDEEHPGSNRVKFTAEPNFEKMMSMLKSGHGISPAMDYACFLMNQVRERSKKIGRGEGRLILPKSRLDA